MTIAAPNAAMALMRDAMDKALAAPTGVRMVILDSAHGSREASHKEAKMRSQRMYQARSSMRKLQAKASLPGDGIAAAAAGNAADPDAYRTAYDILFASIDRRVEDDGWVLSILKADASALGLEVF